MMTPPECNLSVNLLETTQRHVEIIELHLSRPEGFTWNAGDYLWLKPTNSEPKPFSIASLPDETKIRLQIAHLDNIKPWLEGLISTRSGLISTAVSQFHWPETSEPIICFAGGTGITPIITLLQTHLTTSSNKVNLYWGIRHHALAYLKSELDELQAKHTNFSYQIILSAESDYPAEYVQHGLIPDLLNNGQIQLTEQVSHILICGPWAMVGALKAILPTDRIKSLQH